MRTTHIFSSTCIAVVVMLLLSLSVHPAMAAEAVNEELGNCAACGMGMNSLSSIPGFEGKKIPTVSIREIPVSGNLVSTASTRSAAAPATVSGTQKRHVNAALTLDIRDPLSMAPVSAASRGTNSASAIEDPAVASVVANMSRAGFDLSSVGTHWYESTVRSDDFLALNSSQKAALAAAGFSLTASDTMQSDRDVAFYTFTNRTTGSRVYLMAVQNLDSAGSPVGKRALALSPEFTATGIRIASSSAGTSSGDSSSCAAEWVAVVLALVLLVVSITMIAFFHADPLVNIFAAAAGEAITYLTGSYLTEYWEDSAGAMEDRVLEAVPRIKALAVATGIALLLVLLYTIYKLGVCMGWWNSWDEVGWSYQYRFNETANGNTVPLSLHDRFALALYADTVADSNAHWMVATHPGLVIRDELKVKTDKGSLQSWLVEAEGAGPHEFTLKYITSKPLPEGLNPEYTLLVSVDSGKWKITSVDDTGTGSAAGAFPSLRIDASGTPRMSYSSARLGKILYGELSGNSWSITPVADSAGTYSTSLALAPSGMPAISFGDGLHFGNLMYAERDGTSWNVSVVNNGIPMGGDVGEYSSLAFDPYGDPYITFNNGQYITSLHYALRNGSRWYNSSIDRDGLSGVNAISSSLAIDKAGTRHVAYNDRRYFGNLMYAKRTRGTAWNFTRIDDGGGSTASTGFDPSLALDSHGYPHISYYNSSGSNLRYASWDGSSWNLETVDTGNDVGRYSSLALDASDVPHISYYDATYQELRYATFAPALGRWVIRTIDNDGDVGLHTSIALDRQGHPSIAYYDEKNHALKFARWIG